MKNIIAYLRARPAIVAALVSIAGTVGADLGMHLTPAQFTTIVAALNALLGVAVHASTGPKPAKAAGPGEHEKPGG